MKDFEKTAQDHNDLKAARTYLKAQGWVAHDDYWDDIVIFRRPEEENRPCDEVVLPKKVDKTFDHYLEETARRLAQWDNQTEEEALFRLLHPDVDRVRCRLISPELESGTTPLYVIQDFVAGVVDALKAAVLDVAKPELWHKRLRSAEIDKMMKQAKFGQTERGSFILNLFVPLEDADEANKFEGTSSRLWRRGIVHLTTALSEAVDAIESGAPENFEQKNKENPQTSANLLEAIDAAAIGEDAALEFSVDWAPVLRVPESTPSTVTVQKSYAPQFKEWARSFRPAEKDKEKARFVATVRELKGAQRDDDGRPYGDVVLWIFNQEEDRNFEAKTSLNTEQYDVALDAHKRNYCVSFDGVCVWNGNKATLDNIEGFGAIDFNRAHSD
ncbi:MAG: hypothetical protein IK077_10015 [Thermoguttaceae bacterium]|nr:hypothetical protein [Thermoguttaceae bacterium]